MEFISFNKIPRFNRDIIITEKIDGTNASICFDENMNMYVGSRNKWITPENDNYGFAKWAYENELELKKLGIGRHYGEWFGKGIQRTYGMNDRKFALFNVSKWNEYNIPFCCTVVPILYKGIFSQNAIKECLFDLELLGSKIVFRYMKPEGIVIYHTASHQLYKVTLENDEKYKGQILAKERL